VEVASAGQPAPLIRRRSGEVELVPVGGNPLGVLEEPAIGTATTALGRGESLALVSEAAVHATRDGAPFGMEGVRRALAAAPADAGGTADAVAAAVLAHADGHLDDDLAALVLQAVE
jgi:serine phosphatase RsbU (regulator of sigma subunit)